jgi:maleylacetoacetate isomerase
MEGFIMQLELFDYARSSAAFRVRIALRHKGLEAHTLAVRLLDGEQHSPDFTRVNPQGQVPVLLIGEEPRVLTQSLSIIEYLDEAFPHTPPLVWGDPMTRARIRSLALLIACDIHPLNNLRVKEYLSREAGLSSSAIDRWAAHWIITGLAAFEAQLDQGPYVMGQAVSLADVCLVPQVFNAKRLNVSLEAMPKILERFEALMKLAAFAQAAPGGEVSPAPI